MSWYAVSESETIRDVAEGMIARARKDSDCVTATVDGVQLIAYPTSSPEDIIADYRARSQRRRQIVDD
jgi:hypothetical protein